MRISDWSSDVCSSDLPDAGDLRAAIGAAGNVARVHRMRMIARDRLDRNHRFVHRLVREPRRRGDVADRPQAGHVGAAHRIGVDMALGRLHAERFERSEEHTSELQSLMRISYAVFCLKKKNMKKTIK